MAKDKHVNAHQFERQLAERSRRQHHIEPELEHEVKRDKNRLLAATTSSGSGAITHDELDAMEHRRHNAGAHGSTVAMNGRDLSHHGRAVPNWMQK